MELSKKSWHYKLYQVLNGKGARNPTNFCPYFWKTIVLGSIFTIIFLPIAIPLILTRKIMLAINKDEAPPSLYEYGLYSFYTLIAVFYNVIITVVFCMFAMWFFPLRKLPDEKYDIMFVHLMGTIGWLLSMVIGVIALIKYVKEKRRERKEELIDKGYGSKENPPNVLVEGIKAWYKKHCPIITWK